MTLQRHFTGSPWEPKIAYCRALRTGNMIVVSGTAPVDDNGQTFAPGDAYAQTKRCLEIIEKALIALDASLAHVIRTRMYVTDISRWQEYGQAHGEVFRDFPPVTSMVEVKGLIDPDMLIEVEVDAWIDT
jgi:enamine deaminase RidA (YjgF/YER057c/UK114 family)